MKIEDKYESLITHDLLGDIDGEGKKELHAWLEESEENQKYYSDRKKVWESIQTLKKMETIDERKAFKKVSSQLFTGPKQHFITGFQKIAAVLIIPIIIAASWLYVVHHNETKLLSSVYQTAETPLGMRSNLYLPDGTKVWLNAGSSIKYPVLFANNKRNVRIQGEVYFEVKKDRKRPFVVNMDNGIEVEVLGTSFNCAAYPGCDLIQTALIEGSVRISNTVLRKEMIMKPGELAVFAKSTNSLSKSKVDLEKYIAWKSGKLMFRDDPMDVVVRKLEQWYNVDINIVDEKIKNYIYTATFNNESLEQVLKMLELSAPIKSFMVKRDKMPDGSFSKQIIYLNSKN